MKGTQVGEKAGNFSQVLERVSRLTSSGMQCFIGRLIAAGTDIPATRAEMERALERLETDQDFREKCWRSGEETLTDFQLTVK